MSTSLDINPARVDFVTLRLFCAVATAGSITKGAEQCYLALSAASRRISDFEAAAGAALLERTAQGIALTPAGHVALQHATHGRQAILDAMESKIVAVGPGSVSRHCADPTTLNVVDIAPSSISSAQKCLAALGRARDAGQVSKFFSPANGDPAFHVEIPQPPG